MSARNNYITSKNKPTTYRPDKRFKKHEVAVTLNSKDKNKKMSIEEISDFGKRILNSKKNKSEYPDEVKMMIVAVTDLGLRTISGYHQNIEDIEKRLDDYLNGYIDNSADLSRFKELSSVQYTVVY